VLHVGFADHSPLIDEKRRSGAWLHDRISEVAQRAVGVDIDAEVVEMLKAKGVQDIYALDVTQEVTEPAIRDTAFDLVILGEVLEHIGNPVAFLQGLKANFGRPGQRLLVTVPNALNLHSVLDIARTQECVNTDHRFWFTPYTLARVLTEAGFTVDQVETCLWGEVPNTLKGRTYRTLVSRFGLLQDHLVAFARVADSATAS
jgi:predicted TPR repeat methyltransferase